MLVKKSESFLEKITYKNSTSNTVNNSGGNDEINLTFGKIRNNGTYVILCLHASEKNRLQLH